MSDLIPHMHPHADTIALLRSCAVDSVIHAPAHYQMNSGRMFMGYPSLGSWVTYGLGSESENLPAFVVMAQPQGTPEGGAPCWSSGFLPAAHQGTLFRTGNSPIVNLAPEKYRKDKTFANPKNSRVWIEAGELFEPSGEGERLSKAGKERIDAAIGEMGERVIGAAIVVEGYAISGDSGGQLGLAGSRATLVRNYLQARFHLDGQNLGTVPLRGVPPPSTRKSSWNGICIVLLSQAA